MRTAIAVSALALVLAGGVAGCDDRTGDGCHGALPVAGALLAPRPPAPPKPATGVGGKQSVDRQPKRPTQPKRPNRVDVDADDPDVVVIRPTMTVTCDPDEED